MNTEEYNSLISFAKKRIRIIGISTSLIQAEDIINDAFLKAGDKATHQEYEKEINNLIYAVLKTPKTIPIIINNHGTLLNRDSVKDECMECKSCKEIKPINEFTQYRRYKTGFVFRLKKCKICEAKKDREYYQRKRERKREIARQRISKAKQKFPLWYIKKLIASPKGIRVKDITQEMLQKKYHQLKTMGVRPKRQPQTG